MHEQNGTLVRDGTERMMLMEVCPVCGEQRRDNARFCTTCGHRFMVEELLAEPLSPASTAVRHELSSADIPVVPGWPAPATSADTSPWAPSSSDRGGWPAPPEEAASSDLLEVTWAEIAANALRSPRRAQPAVAVADLESEPAEDYGDLDVLDIDPPAVLGPDDDQLRQRARSLLDELRDVINGLTGKLVRPGDEIAQELEISLTQPAALEGEALADLRKAAEAAQERPRDLDTLTALTGHAGTILALIVGYERATAGIERAIDTLRGGPDTAVGGQTVSEEPAPSDDHVS